jgi:hypothetical protein
MRPGALYRRTVDPGRFWYTRPPKGTAQRLVRRFEPRIRNIKVRDFLTLTAARADLVGVDVLVVRHLRGVDPVTGRRFEREDYVALPPDYKLREVKRPPNYEVRT